MKFVLQAVCAALFVVSAAAREKALLNASYDATRELYEMYNPAFVEHWFKKSGQKVTVRQSHGGSAKQTRAVMDGLDADVVSLALGYDIDILAEKGRMLPSDWSKKLPDNSAPYSSTIVFLVRTGNPKKIKDWEDLVRPGVAVITPNPKTSGGARWNYLAAWAFATRKYSSETEALEFMRRLFRNVPLLDAGARGATTTFVSRGVGDVLIAWENEALVAAKEFTGKFEIVIPSLSIVAEPCVAVVERVARRRGTSELAQAYLDYLFSPTGQDIIAKNHFRPRSTEVLAKYSATFPRMDAVTIADLGGWAEAQKKHFSLGGTFDKSPEGKLLYCQRRPGALPLSQSVNGIYEISSRRAPAPENNRHHGNLQPTAAEHLIL